MKKVIEAGELIEVRGKVEGWATKLRDDLIHWAKEQGFESLTQLAHEFGYKPRDAGWRSLTTGGSIATDTTLYAKLYKRTNLSSADPRTIPPKYVARRNGGFTLIPRAWTDEDWNDWIMRNDANDSVVSASTANDSDDFRSLAARLASVEAQLAQLVSSGNRIDGNLLWDLLLTPIISRIAEGVRGELGSKQDSAVDPISDTITLLLKLLMPVVEGSRAGRDLFAQQYGRQAADLGTLLTALVHPNVDTREVMITYRKQGAA